MQRLSARSGQLCSTARWTALLALALAGGCERRPAAQAEAQPVPFTIRAADMSIDGIPDQPVGGELAGEPFVMEEAVFRVEGMPRRERVDVWISDQRFRHCGVPLPTEARKVWLRFPGIVDLEVGEYRVEAADADPPFRLHYEVPGHPGWQQADRGAALLLIDSVDSDSLSGRVRACFDDGADSCVEGRFRAESCTGPLDVDDDVAGAGVLGVNRPIP